MSWTFAPEQATKFDLMTPRSASLKIVIIGIIGAILLSGCSKESEQQQSSTDQRAPLGEQAGKPTEEKAWADALAAGSAAAFRAYLESFAAGPHAAEARVRLATLEAQARREADEKAWADASRSGTAAAFSGYLRAFENGAHAAQARTRVAALEEQARKDADEKAWAEASQAGTAAQYNAYLRSFGTGAHAAEARERLAALEEQSRKQADDKVWTEAVRLGTTASFNNYLQSFSTGAHVAEARERLAALEVQARKEADDKAWAEALRVGGVGAFKAYLQNFAGGSHAADARARIATLDQQARQVPKVAIENTCRAGEIVLSGLSGGDTSRTSYDTCMDSEQGARDQMIKDWETFSASERTRCVQPKIYLPSYVEWLTCLEMERVVRKLKEGSPATVGVEPARAGPCSNKIAQFEQAVRRSANNPGDAPIAPQSVGAQLGHQPTPASIEEAQQRGWAAFDATLRRAKQLDARGDRSGCRRALAAAKRMYNLQ